MNLFLGSKTQASMSELDKRLEGYFASSRRYRGALRRGSLVLLDKTDGMYKFLNFLVSKCGFPISVVHIDSAANAKRAVIDLGIENVRVVIIDSGMLGESLNGGSFTYWLSQNYPNIPIWVSNCDTKTQEWIREHTLRIGVLPKNENLVNVVTAIGLPSECKELALSYSV